MPQRRNTSRRDASIRIIGGTWRRRLIPIAGSAGLRPTPDRVRETLFNWLDPELPGAACLDLFAGSGVLGFEALSRGARHAVLVERDAAACRALGQLARELDAAATVINDDANAYLSRSERLDFDIVFVDPPYSSPVADVLSLLTRGLAAGARIYLERRRGDDWPESDDIVWGRRRTAGAVAFGLGTVVAADM